MSKAQENEAEHSGKKPEELLLELIVRYYGTLLEEATKNAKVGELIRMMEYYRKIAPDETSQSKMWEKLEKIRQQVLAKKTQSAGKTTAKAASKSNRKKPV